MRVQICPYLQLIVCPARNVKIDSKFWSPFQIWCPVCNPCPQPNSCYCLCPDKSNEHQKQCKCYHLRHNIDGPIGTLWREHLTVRQYEWYDSGQCENAKMGITNTIVWLFVRLFVWSQLRLFISLFFVCLKGHLHKLLIVDPSLAFSWYCLTGEPEFKLFCNNIPYKLTLFLLIASITITIAIKFPVATINTTKEQIQKN